MNFATIDPLNTIIQKIAFLDKKEYLLQAHVPTKNIYAVYKGSCKEYWIDGNGNECVTNFYFPGDLVGLESVCDHIPLLSVVALEPSEFCIIPLEDLYVLMQQESSILKRFINVMGFKMRNDRSVKMGNIAHERVSDFLLNVLSRMKERSLNNDILSLPMSQIDISSFLGITHETVNRILKNFQKEGVISIKNKVISFIDIPKLESLSRSRSF